MAYKFSIGARTTPGIQTFSTGLTASNGIGFSGQIGGTGHISGSGHLQAGGNAYIGGTAEILGACSLRGAATISGKLSASNGIHVTGPATLAEIPAVGSDVDKFLVSNSGVIGFRTGAQVASDIGAVASDANITFSGKLTSSNGMLFADDQLLVFGDGADASIEYDEDGTNELRFAGADVTFEQDVSFDGDVDLGLDANDVVTVKGEFTASLGALIPDDKKLYFGTQFDASIEYDEDATNELLFAGAAASFAQHVTLDSTLHASGAVTLGTIAEVGSDVDKFLCSDSGVIKYVDGANLATYIGAVAQDANITFSGKLTSSNGMLFADDQLLVFGDGADASIEYDEDGTNELRFAGADVTFEQDVSFDGDVELGLDANDVVTVKGEFTASLGALIPDDKKLYFGTNFDSSIEYDENGDNNLKIAGAPTYISTQLTAANGLSIDGGVFTVAGMIQDVNDTNVVRANYTVTVDDLFILAAYTASAGQPSLIISLPSSPAAGETHIIKDCSGSCASNKKIEITGSGGGQIDGFDKIELDSAYASVNLLFNGTQWNIY